MTDIPCCASSRARAFEALRANRARPLTRVSKAAAYFAISSKDAIHSRTPGPLVMLGLPAGLPGGHSDGCAGPVLSPEPIAPAYQRRGGPHRPKATSLPARGQDEDADRPVQAKGDRLPQGGWWPKRVHKLQRLSFLNVSCLIQIKRSYLDPE